MITIIMGIVAVFFGIKIIWNVGVPFELARKASLDKNDKRGGISVMPYIEIILLLILIIFSALSNGSAWFNHPIQVALWGAISIGGSYILLIVFAIGLGLIDNFKKKRDL